MKFLVPILLVLCIACASTKPTSLVEHDNDLKNELMQIVLEANKLKKDGILDPKYALYEIINNIETTISIEDWATLGEEGFATIVLRQGGIYTNFLSEVVNLVQSSIETLYSNPLKRPTSLDFLEFGTETNRIVNFYNLENIVSILRNELKEAKDSLLGQ